MKELEFNPNSEVLVLTVSADGKNHFDLLFPAFELDRTEVRFFQWNELSRMFFDVGRCGTVAYVLQRGWRKHALVETSEPVFQQSDYVIARVAVSVLRPGEIFDADMGVEFAFERLRREVGFRGQGARADALTSNLVFESPARYVVDDEVVPKLPLMVEAIAEKVLKEVVSRLTNHINSSKHWPSIDLPGSVVETNVPEPSIEPPPPQLELRPSLPNAPLLSAAELLAMAEEVAQPVFLGAPTGDDESNAPEEDPLPLHIMDSVPQVDSVPQDPTAPQ